MNRNEKRRARRAKAAERRATLRAARDGGFTKPYYMKELKKKRNREAVRIREKRKQAYERKIQRVRTYYETEIDRQDVPTIIRELWDMGIKIQNDDYYKDFIDEHENIISRLDIKGIVEDKLRQAEENLSYFDEADTDPLGLF